MTLFDFLKKNEILRIKQLESEIAELSKYKDIVDVEKEIERKKSESESELKTIQGRKERVEEEIWDLEQKYNNALFIYQRLKHQNELYTDSLDIAEYGVYEPHFDFDVSETYKNKISFEREKQKQMIKDNYAVIGGDTITWNNNLLQGQAMVKRVKKLMMRAFNGECDSFIASVEWNNVKKMEERIHKSFDAINMSYHTQGVRITVTYKASKIHELYLAYEYKRKKQEEKEEQRMIREQMREEEKAAREFEVARIKAEKEEVDYQKAIEKAKIEAQNTEGEKHDKLIAKIQELEERLKEAEANKERAISMAQQTRRGHVYIISNIGSFGENIYKIGMTRRLDPMDRVRELGDASVPFAFDLHAMIYSEDAPSLENALHKAFSNRRVNMINMKREFFNVSLSEIEKIVIENHGVIEFAEIAEAEQYRETLAIKQKSIKAASTQDELFPKDLFAKQD